VLLTEHFALCVPHLIVGDLLDAGMATSFEVSWANTLGIATRVGHDFTCGSGHWVDNPRGGIEPSIGLDYSDFILACPG